MLPRTTRAIRFHSDIPSKKSIGKSIGLKTKSKALSFKKSLKPVTASLDKENEQAFILKAIASIDNLWKDLLPLKDPKGMSRQSFFEFQGQKFQVTLKASVDPNRVVKGTTDINVDVHNMYTDDFGIFHFELSVSDKKIKMEINMAHETDLDIKRADYVTTDQKAREALQKGLSIVSEDIRVVSMFEDNSGTLHIGIFYGDEEDEMRKVSDQELKVYLLLLLLIQISVLNKLQWIF